MSVDQYDAKFEELAKFSSYLKYNHNEPWTATKFESGLNPKIKKELGTFERKNFSMLVNKCRVIF